MSETPMQRGAREANEESDRAAWSRDMGQAIGGLAGLVVAINALAERVERLERAVNALTGEAARDIA